MEPARVQYHLSVGNSFYVLTNKNDTSSRAVVVAQLVERLLPVPEVCGSNPVTGKKIYGTFTVNCIKKTKIKKKVPGMAHFLKKE